MNKKLIIFTLVTCLFSWLFWIPIIQIMPGSPFEAGGLVPVLFFAGAYGPTLMGILLTWVYDRGDGLKALFRRAVKVKVGMSNLLVGLLAGPVLYALSVILYVLVGGELGMVNYGLLPWIPVIVAASIIFGPLAEEFGWRGFALPLLNYQERPVMASIVIGFIWALWHTPLFWAQTGTAISGFPVTPERVALFFMAVIGSSFIYTWLFSRTSASLFVAIFLHLSMNASGTISGMLYPDLTPEQQLTMYKLYTLGLWIFLAVAALVMQARKNARVRSASGA